jgi:hypothetical protein
MIDGKTHMVISFIVNAFASARDWLLKDSLNRCKAEIEKSIAESEKRILHELSLQRKEANSNNFKVLEIVSNILIKDYPLDEDEEVIIYKQ